jgi:RNA polymerase sigma-70 factor (ECF subfamily)
MATDFSKVNHTKVLLSTAEERCRAIYDKHRGRIYSLAFWMTNNKSAAERLASRTFLRSFASGPVCADQIDQAFVAEVRDLIPMDAPHPGAALEAVSKIRHTSIDRT